MSAPLKSGRSGSRGEPEKTRAAILKAALKEFAYEGVSGARTDEIARSAGVNKALLYYYFKDKEGLYHAVLDRVFADLYERVRNVLERQDLRSTEKLLLYAETHFDYIASSPVLPRLVQREYMRSGTGASSLVNRIIKRHGRPIYAKLMELIAQGSKSGDFRQMDPAQTVTSILGVIVFYFISIPAQQLMASGDPFSPTRIAARRSAVLDFVAAAVFAPGAQKKGSK